MKHYCVISHTHWDREWYMPLSQFRFRLVDLIDRCLKTLEEDPEYIFHLDAQTIVLEDYLAVRPAMEGRLKEEIRAGRLVIGPWYLQNDFYLVSGEATVRNLLEGARVAAEFGPCMKVGYAPDQFGNVSQLPQLLRGFGIDNFVFGRGYSFYDEKTNARLPRNTEFLWKGADGSELLAIHMAHWYNNAQRFSAQPDKAKLLLDVVERLTDPVATTPYRLLMNGVDHLEAQDDLLPILEKLRQENPQLDVRQWNLEDYVAAVGDHLKQAKTPMQTHEGELRWGNDWELLTGTHSSRVYLKRANVRGQDLMEAKLEPLYAMLEALGGTGAYPGDHLRFLWRQLLHNHPHDSICACSRDEVHTHMEDIYQQHAEAGEYLLDAGLRIAAEHFRFSQPPQPNDYVLLAVNPTQSPLDQVIEMEIDLLEEDGLDNFTILDDGGNPADFAVADSRDIRKDLFSPLNLPGWKQARRHRIYLDARGVAPMAAKGWRITRAQNAAPLPAAKPAAGDSLCMENGEVAVTVHADGRVDCLYKATGRLAKNCLRWEDMADPGDAYIYYSTDHAPIYGEAFPASVQLVEDNDFVTRCTIGRELLLPGGYDAGGRRRREDTVPCKAVLTLTLRRTGPLEVAWQVDNRAEDHRLRLLVDTGVAQGACHADTAYDVLPRTEDQHYHATMSPTFPNATFALLEDAKGGVAAATEGNHEFQNLGNGVLAFTVLRATGTINRDPQTLEGAAGDRWDVPGNQCLREIRGRLGLLGYAGDYIGAGIPVRARQFRVGLLTHCTPCDPKKFSGGRTAVQDTNLEELFYLPDPFPGLALTDNGSCFTVEGRGLTVTAAKKAEGGEDLLLRVVNLSTQPVEGRIAARGYIGETPLSEEGWKPLGRDDVRRSFGPKEIVTFRIRK